MYIQLSVAEFENGIYASAGSNWNSIISRKYLIKFNHSVAHGFQNFKVAGHPLNEVYATLAPQNTMQTFVK